MHASLDIHSVGKMSNRELLTTHHCWLANSSDPDVTPLPTGSVPGQYTLGNPEGCRITDSDHEHNRLPIFASEVGRSTMEYPAQRTCKTVAMISKVYLSLLT